jgi:putative hydrolase of the HAD superfamily
MDLEAVIFDVGGVLLVPHYAQVNAALDDFGVALDAAGAERAHYEGVHALDAAAENMHAERQAYVVGYARSLGVAPGRFDEVLSAMRTLWSGPTLELWAQPVSGSVDGLRRVAASGLKLGIVSNADGSIEEQLRRSEICQVGEGLGVPVLAIVDSHVVGVEKPAAAIFSHALDPIGVVPERALYVGDTVRYDVRGARAAGLHPLHYDPFGLCSQRSDHPHAASFDDIVALT